MKNPFQKAMIAASAIAALHGCRDLEPCANIDQGDRLRIEVLGPRATPGWDEALCAADWGFAQGMLIEGTIVDIRGDSECEPGVLETQGAGGWEWTLNSAYRIIGMHTLESHYDLSKDECKGLLDMRLSGPDSSRCDPGTGETCVLEVRLSPKVEGTALCPPRCSTRLNVRFERTE